MSASFITTAIYGVILPKNFGQTVSPNPAYNPEAPFDPKTGRKVPEVLTQELDLDGEAKMYGLAIANTTDGEDTVIGIGARSTGIGEQGSEISRLTKDQFTMGLPGLASFCLKYGISDDAVAFCAVGQCSY